MPMERAVVVEPVYTGTDVSAVNVHFTVPAAVVSSSGLDLRIEDEDSTRGCVLVLSGLPESTGATRVELEFEVEADSVRAKFKVYQ